MPQIPCLLRSKLVATLAVSCALAAPAIAQDVHEDALSTNGVVHTILRHGDRIYLGGDFTRIEHAYGGAVATDATTGALVGFPEISGDAYTVVPDGAGGFYMGGAFFYAGGKPRSNMAHVLADYTVSDWNPGAAGVVTSILPSDTTVYYVVRMPDGNSAIYVAGPSTVEGAAQKLKQSSNGPITGLAKVGNTLYVGGTFIYVTDGITYDQRPGVAAIDATTGQTIAAFNPGHPIDYSHPVYTIAANESLVFVGGHFSDFGGLQRYEIAALDATTGRAVQWYANAATANAVNSIILRDSTLYVAGGFNMIGGASRLGLAELDARTGLARPWNPGVVDTRYRLSLYGSTLYSNGFFGLQAYDVVTGEVLGWQPPSVIQRPYDIAAWGPVVYLGTQLNAVEAKGRNKLAALDATTGALLDWNPNVESTVSTIAVDGSIVYIGGDFEKVAGIRRSRLAAVDATTGALLPWDPGADGPVYTLVPDGDTVYVGGQFAFAGGRACSSLAKIHATTGVAAPWGGADLRVYALAVTDSAVYVGGDFAGLGGSVRNNLGALDRSSGLALPWNPDLNNTVYSMQLQDSLLYVSGRFSRVGGIRRGRMAAIDLVTGLPEPWSLDADGGVRSFAISGSTLYLGGEFDSVNGQPRPHLASVDFVTGELRDWHPALEPIVRSIAVGEGVVYAGGAFQYLQHTPRSYLAVVTDDRTTAALVSRFDGEAIEGGIVIRWQLADETLAPRTWIERAASPHGPWVPLRAAPEHESSLYRVTDTEIEPGTSYHYRLVIRESTQPMVFGLITVTARPLFHRVAIGRISPNPTSHATTIELRLPSEAHARVSILDVQGRVVAKLADGIRPAGSSVIRWDARNRRDAAPPGLYFVQLESLGARVTGRFVVTR